MSRDAPSVARRDNAKKGGSQDHPKYRHRVILEYCCDEGHSTLGAATVCAGKRVTLRQAEIKGYESRRIDAYANPVRD